MRIEPAILLILVLGVLLGARGAAAAASAVKPRVVETKYPTEDVVIASAIATDFGVKGDSTGDDTAALQKAIDAVAAAKGGVLFLPEGHYRIDGNLVLRETVTLRGDWLSPEKGGAGKGTLLLITGGRGLEDGKPAIALERGSGLVGVSLWWPDQKPEQIVPYPTAIRTDQTVVGDNITVKNVTLINAYSGVQIGPEWNELHTIRNVYGTVLKLGIYVDATTDIGRLMMVRFSPGYWEKSKLPGAPTTAKQKAAARGFMRENGVGLRMLRSDWEYVYDLSFEGYGCGVQLMDGPNGPCNTVFFGVKTKNCRVGLRIEVLNPFGLAATGCRFEGDESAIVTAPSFSTIAQFNTCIIGGKPKVAVLHEGKGKLSFQNCTFENWTDVAARVTQGSLNAFGCDFKQAGLAVDLEKDAVRAHLLGNRFAGAKPIENKSAGDVQISQADFKFARPDVKLINLPPDPKPATAKLFNVMDYGAKANAKADNTIAFQKALDAARAGGGGTVYVPGGNYRFAGRLRVPSGVELRGVFDVPHHPVSAGSVLMPTADKGNADATAFVLLEKGSGVRGITVWYPEQDSRDISAYPWTIQSLGPECWVMDTTLANAYQGVDFGSHPSRGHLVRYLSGAPLKTGLYVSKSDGEGWVDNVQFNPHYWTRKHDSYPFPDGDTGDTGGRAIGYQNANLNGLVFGNCKKENVLGTFIFAALRGMYFVNDGGGANARVIQHGTDGATTDIVFDAVGPRGVQMINTECVPLFDGARYAIETTSGFAGKVSFFNGMAWGIGATGLLAGSGDVLIQQFNSTIGPLTVTGGRVVLENLHFQAKNTAHVRTEPTLESLLLIGNTGAPFFGYQDQPGKVKNIAGSLPVTKHGD